MKKPILLLVVVLLLTCAVSFANDVSINSSGNITTGVSNIDANLEVIGSSAEHGIVGSTNGTSKAGVYGTNTINNNYGMLGYDTYGVFGYGGASFFAGYFQGNVEITGDLTLGGSLSGYVETDPVYSGSVASGISSTDITNWNTTVEWGSHASAGYDTTDDSWTGTGDVYTISGNVGIGTSSPLEKLHIIGNIDLSDNDIKNADDIDSTYGEILYMNYYSSGDISVVYGGGSFGIGTTSPAAKLHVTGDARYDLNGGQILLSTPGGWPGIIAYTPPSSGGHRRDITMDSSAMHLTVSNSSSPPSANNGISIYESGNVGIGTSPNSKLEVRGEIRSTDSQGNNRLWGEGREYVIISSAWNLCPGNIGTQYAVSDELATWFGSPSACPAGTWVCSLDEVRGVIVTGIPQYTYMDCSGSIYNNLGRHFWTASPSSVTWQGLTKKINEELIFTSVDKCNMRKVMCCRDTQ